MERELPILTRIHKGKKLEDKKIGEGFQTGEMDNGRGVRRKKFETEHGLFSYVDRSLESEYEARRVMRIYNLLKEVGLPVVDFAKIIRKKENEKIKFFLVMEDLTEDGTFSITEVYDKTPQLVSVSSNPLALQESMVRALAIMHNNEVVDFHPGLSFALRTRLQEGDRQEIVVDFRIIDYPNLTQGGLPKGWSGDYNFEKECTSDLRQLLKGIVYEDPQNQHLEDVYKQIRESGEKFF